MNIFLLQTAIYALLAYYLIIPATRLHNNILCNRVAQQQKHQTYQTYGR